ncbi:hypothetical protein HYH03_003303 [Edaphochlamys debaryana]|uniref:Uncharacterized protein n=1 Tax=Edaphochlamys debaryana TaxID=47281 RepID=A0A836C495_9CHLO|nr:hypothetical protein HYH03_003303 [Edaphochlamys debaryana]|eukprot:KAG2498552.1 hypothetical protein HYH03_003303 [Edaphochlamys debaryana]
MYDFCFSPFYALFLGIGGLYGFFAHGSKASLGGGLGSATALTLLCYLSFKHYMRTKRVCVPTVLLELVVAGGLAYMMYRRYERTGAMPALVTASISACFAVFYLWNISPMGPKPAAAKRSH